MKFHLLVAASALVVGLGINGVAFAGGNDNHGDNHDPKPTSATSAAVALTDQEAAAVFNFAKGTVGSNAIGSIGGTGLVNIQQNNGANSVLQDQNTLGAILNCSCTSSSSTNVLDVSLAASEQNALVLGNVSIGATHTEKQGSVQSYSGGHSDGHYLSAHWDNASNAVESSNSLSSFSGTGLYNISQNNGNNSVMQSGNTVAAIIGK